MTEQGVIRDIDWKVEPAKMRSIADEEIENAKKKLDEIAGTVHDQVTLQTLKDFEEVLGSFGEKIGQIFFMKNVSPNKDQRDMADEIEKDAKKFLNEIWGRKD
ncbi:MAG: hypothetical protein ACFFE7_15880, partial [Candidatus Thorarchaeota archaeon]